MRRTFSPNSSLDSEVDLNASYLENTILVTSDLQVIYSGWGLVAGDWEAVVEATVIH